MNTQNLEKKGEGRPKKNVTARNIIPGSSMGRRALSILIKIALLSAIAFVLRILEFPLGFVFPPYLKMDFSDLPAMLGTFAFGPWSGIIIAGIKNLIVFVAGMSQSAGVGEIANFLFSVALVLPGSIYYYWKKTRGTAILSLGIGVVLMAGVSYPLNQFVLLPFYDATFMKYDAIIKMCNVVNPAINTVQDILWYTALFTLIKGIIEALVTFLVYKRMSKVLHMQALNRKKI